MECTWKRWIAKNWIKFYFYCKYECVIWWKGMASNCDTYTIYRCTFGKCFLISNKKNEQNLPNDIVSSRSLLDADAVEIDDCISAFTSQFNNLFRFIWLNLCIEMIFACPVWQLSEPSEACKCKMPCISSLYRILDVHATYVSMHCSNFQPDQPCTIFATEAAAFIRVASFEYCISECALSGSSCLTSFPLGYFLLKIMSKR